jgi:hypothetical protein
MKRPSCCRIDKTQATQFPENHLVRNIYTALDLSWLRSELAPHDSSMDRPSIDLEWMIRMLVVGSARICREVPPISGNSPGCGDLMRQNAQAVAGFAADQQCQQMSPRVSDKSTSRRPRLMWAVLVVVVDDNPYVC